MSRLLVLLSLGLAACPTTGTDTDPDSDTDIDSDSDSDSDSDTDTDTANACTHTGFTVANEEFTFVSGYNTVVYGATTAGSPYDGLNLELFIGLGAPSTPGTYSLTDANYSECPTCVTIAQGCTTTSDCSKDFLAQSGTLTLTAIDAEDGGSLVGSLTDVRLVEVVINENTYESTVVPGGETWCVDSLSFSGNLD